MNRADVLFWVMARMEAAVALARRSTQSAQCRGSVGRTYDRGWWPRIGDVRPPAKDLLDIVAIHPVGYKGLAAALSRDAPTSTFAQKCGTPRRAAASIAVASACVLMGCSTPPAANADRHTSPRSSTCTARVTPDCSGYTYANPSPGTVVVTAPKSSGGNNREFFWGSSGRNEADPTVCATFATGEGIDQQGIVLRLNIAAAGGTSGITVTRNIWMDTFDIFNFHVWKTGGDARSPFILFGSKLIPELPARPAVYPLRMCARIVGGTAQVQFVVWTKGQAEPGWGSSTQGGEARIPAGAPSTGRDGWFAGHLTPGTSMTYRDLTVDGTTAMGLP